MFNEDQLELTIEEIAKQHDISLPSTYRYVSLLRELHLIQTGKRGGIMLTPRVMELSAAAEQSLDLEGIANPILDRLMMATGETAFMMKRYRNEAIFVVSAQPDRALTLSFRSGKSMPLTHGAVAKVLLAFAPGGFRQNYMSQKIHSPKEREGLTKELDLICAQGFAETEGEVDEGIWGCAVPVRMGGVVVCAVSVAGPGGRFDTAKRQEVRSLLLQASKELAERAELE
jgi:DNA-binding IclR family transcriptional regulator